MQALTQHMADRKARERLLSRSAEKDSQWLLRQIAEQPLVAELDAAIVDGRPDQLKAWASKMCTVAGKLDARADLVGQRRWREYASRLGAGGAGGPDLVVVALQARRDLILFLLTFGQCREHYRR